MRVFKSSAALSSLFSFLLPLLLVGCGNSDSFIRGEFSNLNSNPVDSTLSSVTIPDQDSDRENDKGTLQSSGENNCLSRSLNFTVTKLELKAAQVELLNLQGPGAIPWMREVTFDVLQLADQLTSALTQYPIVNGQYGTIRIIVNSLTATVSSNGGTVTQKVPVQFAGDGFVIHLAKPGLIMANRLPNGKLNIETCSNIHVAKYLSEFQISADTHFFGKMISK